MENEIFEPLVVTAAGYSQTMEDKKIRGLLCSF
jgi:hypothetical protein